MNAERTVAAEPGRSELLARMVRGQQLSAPDAASLERLAAAGEVSPQTEEEVLQWLAAEYGLAYASLDEVEIDPALLARFPARVLVKDELLPLEQEDDTIAVAVSRLFATPGLDHLKALTGLTLRPVLAPRAALQRELKRHLGIGADTIHSLNEETPLQVVDEGGEEQTDLDKAADDASIIHFVNQVLVDAVSLRATDIHIEPFEDELRIRYRIDGMLQDVPVPPQVKRFQPAIVSRVKILSALNIAEKRLPQDGRIKIRVEHSEVDIRTSVIPMIHGEAVVMRLLRQDAGLMRLEDLDMAERERRLFDRVLRLPHGIVLVTGPTGSGKTTTLYSALNEINDSIRKIITVEDPVEYQLKGVNQIQVSEKSGLTFARGLRSILRHDPDVILIGEIRDQETARIAVQASLTGHLVFSTLHTNDAASALTRLVDMGIEPYLVASSLEVVVAQRLLRLLCAECRVVDDSVRTRALRDRFDALRDAVLYRAGECRACRQTGYFGRHAIFEMMAIGPDIRVRLQEGVSSGEIKELARRDGMSTLLEDGWRLVRAGLTTPDEVLRVSKDDAMNGNGAAH
ncbi:MAG: type II/IV secretion system protein [Kiritimatiellae bacterium]|nr:type II/IV secretion system protein [Kiritimatiellia bacterium]